MVLKKPVFRIRIQMMRIRIHGSAFRNCGSGSGSGSRLIYESYLQVIFQKIQKMSQIIQVHVPNFFLFSRNPKIDRDTVKKPVFFTGNGGLSVFFSKNLQKSRLLAIFLYPWIRIQRPKNMRIHADPDPDPDPDPKHCILGIWDFASVPQGKQLHHEGPLKFKILPW